MRWSVPFRGRAGTKTEATAARFDEPEPAATGSTSKAPVPVGGTAAPESKTGAE